MTNIHGTGLLPAEDVTKTCCQELHSWSTKLDQNLFEHKIMWVAIKVVQAIKVLNSAAQLDLCILHNGSFPKQQTDSKKKNKNPSEFSKPVGGCGR